MATYSVGRRRVILLLLLTSMLLVTLDLRGNQVFDKARTGFQYATSPFESAAEVVSRPVERVWRGVTEYDDLVDEVQRLQEQVDAQRGAEVAARNALIENQMLQALHDLPALASMPTVTAQFIGQLPSNLDQEIEIDRGTNQGIRTGMAVVNEAGLVGKITRVYPENSLVMLITDSRYAVPVKVISEDVPAPTTVPETAPSGISVDDLSSTTTTSEPSSTSEPSTAPGEDPSGDESTTPTSAPDSSVPSGTDVIDGTTTSTTVVLVDIERETGALRGQGADRLPQVTLIANSIAVTGPIGAGDAVFTTGGRTSLAPPDIPVGTVVHVIDRAGAQGRVLEIEPIADLHRLQFVSVVLYQPPSEVGG